MNANNHSCSSNYLLTMLWNCATYISSNMMKPFQEWFASTHFSRSFFLKDHPTIAVIVLAESIFYLWFRFHVLPYANRLTSYTPPEPFRNKQHQEHRHTILIRLMERLKRRAKYNKRTFDETFRDYMYGWFKHIEEETDVDNYDSSDGTHNSVSRKNSSGAVRRSSSSPIHCETESDCCSETSSVCERNSLTSVSSVEQFSQAESVLSKSPMDASAAANKPDDDKDETTTNNSTSQINDQTDSESNVHPPLPDYYEVRELMSWAFYGKHYDDIVASSKDDTDELDQMFVILKRDYGIQFEKSTAESSLSSKFKNDLQETVVVHESQKKKVLQTSTSRSFLRKGRMIPRKLTLEKVDPVFRPLCIYLIVYMIECVGSIVLRYHGFRKYYSNYGHVGYWYRPGTTSSKKHRDSNSSSSQNRSLLPLVFFHGLAPAGVTFYIPILLNWLYGNKKESKDGDNNHDNNDDDKKNYSTNETPAMFLFENKAISYGMSLYPVNETNCCASVVEALKRHLNHNLCQIEKDGGIRICGHSFGSFQVTWMVHDPNLRPLIRNILLLEPVSVVLSDPDVLNNFLYKRREQMAASSPENKVPFFDRIIYYVACTEVFTEHSLRRHFTWYNFELYLEDVPPNCRVWIGLGEKDEIVNSKKVKDEIDMINHMIEKQRQQQKKSNTTKPGGYSTSTGDKESSTKKLQWLPNPDATIIESKVWVNCGHAACITNKKLWKDVKAGLELT